jgi:large subunit ribosomal protein L10
MPNIVNEMVMREMSQHFDGVEGMLVVSFGGLDVATTEKIRDEVAAKGARLRMVRNNLAQRWFAEQGIDLPKDSYEGNTAIAFGDAEAVIGAAKVFTDKDVKKTKKVQFKGGLMQGQALDASGAAQLANLPDRDTVNAMLLGVISGPARGLACVISALPAGVARVIQAHVDEGASD